MKNAFENNLKQSLENFEMPFDSAAWTAMQSRLDATASAPSFEDKMKEGLNANQYPYNPAAWTAMRKRLDQGAKGGLNKWYYAAAIVGAAAITTASLWNSGENEKTTRSENAKIEKNQSNTNAANATQGNSNSERGNTTVSENGRNTSIVQNNTASSTSNGVSLENGSVGASTINQQGSNQGNASQTNANSGTNATSGNNTGNSSQGGTILTGGDAASSSTAWNFIAPAIPETVCEGSTITIQNDNDFPLVILYPNGLNWVGREHQVTNLNPSVAGMYKVGYLRNNRFKEKTSFTVNEMPTADIDYVDLSQKYLNGLPTIEVRSTSTAAHYKWEYENGTVEGMNAGLHFYDAGLHLVRLTITDENGCSASVEKPINVTEDYNLMAMNAFYPTGNDRTTNTFMPYALTERNVAFKLIIIDPNDGHTLYETSDASEGWDGIDQRSGSLVPLEKSYIWKVTIMNPERGENTVYAGTVLTLPQ